MAQDYAKRRKRTKSTSRNRRRSDSRRKSSNGIGNTIKVFLAGVLCGIFASFLLYLGTLGSDLPAEKTAGVTQSSKSPTTTEPVEKPRARFDFYDLLPEQKLDIEVERQPERQPRHATVSHYVLQAGSFRERQDADRRRAQLLLLNLEPQVEETNGDNGRWFRVYLGPYEDRATMNKARSLTASQGIDTLLLRRERP